MSGVPEPKEPDWGAGDAKTARLQWREIVDELKAQQKLAEANGHMIKRLVMARLLWEQAAADVFNRGPIMKAPKTGVEMQNPWLSIMNGAAKTCSEIEAELTITPRKRAMGGVVKAPGRAANRGGAVDL